MASRSYMEAAEARILRKSTGLSTKAWAGLLDCEAQSVRNMESGGKAIGKQMAMLMTLISHPGIRSLMFDAFRNKDILLKKSEITH